MADLAASDVTYTLQTGRSELTGGSKQKHVYSIAFGDGTDTYPSGGVPLTKAKLGLPTIIEALNFVEDNAGDGYIYKFDESAEKIRIYTADYDATADGPLIELSGGSSAVAATTLIIEVTGW